MCPCSTLPSVLRCIVLISVLSFSNGQNWRGHYMNVLRTRIHSERYCSSYSWWWGCSRHRWRQVTTYYYQPQCQPGWEHDGNYDCIIPICRPSCGNGGTCTSPNTCDCPTTATGQFCQTLTCSYRYPCYPGNCHHINQCQCETGFKSIWSTGCLSFDAAIQKMYPTIGRSTATLADIRRSDNRTNFMYSVDGTNKSDVIWSNQKRFNNLQFQFESIFPEIEGLPQRPDYVHDSSFGIVRSQIQVNVSKISRSGSPVRDPGSLMTYNCNNGASDDSPITGVSNCTINDDQFRTLIEHGDWLNIKYQSDNGGYRKLTNTDRRNQLFRVDHYKGLSNIKEVEFKFDFIAPKFCQENGSFASCPLNPVMLEVEEEITKNPIKLRWNGWTDDLSGLLEYYTEIFRLLPNPYGMLTERYPLSPISTNTTPHQSQIAYPEYRPNRPGIFSVLMETRDLANNSRIARRFVIYDDQSDITVSTDESERLFVSSADAVNGYNWQTTIDADNKSTVVVTWVGHFANKLHDAGKYLNPILAYPIQFKNIQDDGVLHSRKYVAEALDDYEGQLTRNGVTNFHGIVKFEVNKVFTDDTDEPSTGWENINPLAETTRFKTHMRDGQGVRVWVKAYDIMGHVKTDSTYIRVDTTEPLVSNPNSTDTNLMVNYNNGKYNFTTRIRFKAVDVNSGVDTIAYNITVNYPGKDEAMIYTGKEPANKKPEDGFCIAIDGICFYPDQTLDLNNCWFMVAKEDLDTSFATVFVTAYNKAMLSKTIEFEIPHIKRLQGLEKYSGPENFRIEKTTSEGFRVAWDIPDKVSCYGLAEIILVVVHKTRDGRNQTDTVVVPGGNTYVDLLGRTPNTEYHIFPAMRLAGGNTASDGINLAIKTPAQKSGGGLETGVITGVAIGVIAIVAIVVVIFVILIRRGHLQPVQRGIMRAGTIVARKTRQSLDSQQMTKAHTNHAYDNRTSSGEELYIYADTESQSWHIPRNEVTFEKLLKKGHFANIYKATLKGNRTNVVAKTLKEGFTENDKTLMKAKINFTATAVGSHPNVLKFIGAVVDDTALGPFIICEYCEHGPLKDYLQAQRSNLTVEFQECLVRFGLNIACGMEYLASKGIVHRRLAARNILLNFLKEIKIAGFGPQPTDSSDNEGDGEKEKRERIPIKWMAPESMSSTAGATEKSDVWSYAVLLWEIFTLGETPFESIRSRDLPYRIRKGIRLQQPENCDYIWYGVMKQCWNMDPEKRPTFSSIRKKLDGLFVAAPGEEFYYYKR